jgi:TP901 family phage tail tape measure protein
MADRTLTVKILGDERDLIRAFGRSSRATTQFEAQMTGVSRSVRNVFAAAGVALGATAIVQALRSTISAAIDFESSFAGVRKTVDATEPQLQVLARGFRDLARDIPVSVDELNRIGEAAGQLGIQRSAILDFTETIAAIGVSTNLATDQAADAFARLANITQIPQDQFDNLGSTVVELGNKLAATESEITDFGLRIAAAGKIVGLTVDETLAIAGAFTSVGVEAEAGGTAVSKVFIALANAVQTGGKQLETFAATAGTSVAEFRRVFETDTSGAFTAFVEGLKRIDAEGGNVFKTLRDLGLSDVRLIRAFLSISQSGDLLNRSLEVGSRAWDENSALQEEAAKRYETTASKLQIFRNRVNDLQITLGNVLAPALLEIVTPLGEWLEKTENQERVQRELSAALEDARDIFQGVRDVVVPLAEGVKALADRMGGLRNAVELLLVAMVASKVVGFGTSLAGLGTAAQGTRIQVSALRLALLRLGAIGVITLSIEFLSNYDEISGQFQRLLRFANLISDPPTTKTARLDALREKLESLAQIYGINSDKVRELRGEIAKLEDQLGINPSAAELHTERPTQGLTRTSATTREVRQTREAMAEIAKSGDAIIAKITRQVAAQEDLNRQLRDSETRAAHLRDLIRADPENTKLQQRLSAELTKQATLQEQIAAEGERSVAAAAEATAAARAQVAAMFDLRAAQADLTTSLQDNLRVAKEREQNLTRLRDLNRGDLDIAQQLVNATRERRDLEQQIAQNQREQRQARQFQQLGLTATGEKRAPGIQALIGRQASLEEQVKGTFLDTNKTRQKFKDIAAVLAQGPKEVGREIRLAILAMFNEIAGALKEGTETGPLTKFQKTGSEKLLAGLGLSEEEIKALRQRLAQVGPGGTVPGQGIAAFGFNVQPTSGTTGGGTIIVNGNIIVQDPRDVATFIREIQKKGKRSAGSRRGVRPGSNRGLS